MVHLGQMDLEAILFFETVEDIYRRIFREIKPGASIPTVSVQFCRYANANSRVRLNGSELSVRVSDLLQTAPSPVQEALAWILLRKLFQKAPDRQMTAVYQRYMDRPDVRAKLHSARRERGRKLIDVPAGKHFDLTKIFADLNARYFQGGVQQPLLGWSRKFSHTVLGHYDPVHHAIVIAKSLDSVAVPHLLLEYVMFHEILHIQHPAESRGARCCIHTRQFKEAEKRFAFYKEARKAMLNLSWPDPKTTTISAKSAQERLE